MSTLSRAEAEKVAEACRLAAQGKFEAARLALLRLLAKHPRDTDLLCQLVTVLAGAGEKTQALFYAEQAAKLAPTSGNIACNHANALIELGRFDDAVQLLQGAMTRIPDHDGLPQALTYVLHLTHRNAECVRVCRDALAKFPGQPTLLGNLASALLSMGRARESIEVRTQSIAAAAALRHGPPTYRDLTTIGGLAPAFNYVDGADPADITAAHRQYGEALTHVFGPSPARPPITRPDPDRPLRIGLLSPDFRDHAVAFFSEPLLRHHDRARLSLVCYSSASREDAYTERLRPLAAAWRTIASDSWPALFEHVRRDDIDILIDLAGHTTGHRLPLLHMRPAPVQMTWIGYPNTTGIAAVDRRIVDSITDPPGFEPHSVERLLRLDPCFLCYQPRDGAPDLAIPPSSRGEPITFGFFSSVMKLSGTTIALWSRVLERVPGSRLLLKTHALADPDVAADIRARFTGAGLNPARLILEGPGAGAAEMLSNYARVDVALDAFPYSGTTTICEATWMGVPTVTLAGPTSASRVATSLLTSVGVPELCASIDAHFIDIAAALALDLPRRVELRSTGERGLRARMARSSLTDAPGMATRFEHAMRLAWRDACSKS